MNAFQIIPDVEEDCHTAIILKQGHNLCDGVAMEMSINQLKRYRLFKMGKVRLFFMSKSPNITNINTFLSFCVDSEHLHLPVIVPASRAALYL